MSKSSKADNSSHWKPGQSGNPLGRPGGFRGVARLIMDATDNLGEVVEFFLRMMRDEDLPPNIRAGAANWLADRAIGRAQQVIKLETETQSIDWSAVLAQLPDDVLRQVVAAMESAAGHTLGDPPATEPSRPPTALPAPEAPHEDRQAVPAAPLRLALPPAGDPPGDPSDPQGGS